MEHVAVGTATTLSAFAVSLRSDGALLADDTRTSRTDHQIRR